jgi:methanogenic corrinoid protein MtbC1
MGFDSATIELTLSLALAAHPLEMVCLEVVQPALVDLGERWHRGEISPAIEHFATALVRRRLDQLAAVLDTGGGRPMVVLGTGPGEQHEIGILILGLFMRRRGLQVIYLGTDVSVEAAVEVSRRRRPDMVCLSATTPAAAQQLRAVAVALAQLDPPRPQFAFGGQAFVAEPALIEAVPGTFLGRDAREATATAVALLHVGANGAISPDALGQADDGKAAR